MQVLFHIDKLSSPPCATPIRLSGHASGGNEKNAKWTAIVCMLLTDEVDEDSAHAFKAVYMCSVLVGGPIPKHLHQHQHQGVHCHEESSATNQMQVPCRQRHSPPHPPLECMPLALT
jgi:hypothetical protein